MAKRGQERSVPEEGLDEVDRALIGALQQDGRLTYADLGKLVGLSPGGARLRVRRLEERNVLEVVAVTDPLMLGYERMSMLGISIDGDVRAAADAIGVLDEVIYLVIGAGTFDLMVEVIAANADALFTLINDHIRRVPGVTRCETFSYYEIHTQLFVWGTR
jgi:Lrp/AsnC family transcriptional regulator, regulator for asnA, asnC and gidA